MNSTQVTPVGRLVRHVVHGRNPLARSGDRVQGRVLIAMLTWLFGVMFLVTGDVLVQWALDRKRHLQWQDDWARIEPMWTGR